MIKRGLYYKLVEAQEQGFTSNNTSDQREDSLNLSQSDGSTSSSRSLLLGEIDIRDSIAVAKQNQSLEEFKETESEISIWTLIRLSKPEWKYITLGVVGSAIMGLSPPVYAIVYGELMGLLDQSLQEDVQRLNDILALVISTANHFDVSN